VWLRGLDPVRPCDLVAISVLDPAVHELAQKLFDGRSQRTGRDVAAAFIVFIVAFARVPGAARVAAGRAVAGRLATRVGRRCGSPAAERRGAAVG
jgi:hypothetical protein